MIEDAPISDDPKRSRSARVVIGLLLAMVILVIGSIGTALYSFQNRVCALPHTQIVDADFRSLESALQMYRLTCGNYPTTEQGLKALVERPVISPVPVRWTQMCKRDIKDSWGNSYGYKFPGSKDPTKPEIICKGPDGIEATEDDVSSQSD